MRQVGLEAEWLHILKQYVTPIQLYTFAGALLAAAAACQSPDLCSLFTEKNVSRLSFSFTMPSRLCAGYYHEAYARMNFVVRYHPQEQDRLRPHHDSSTFTLTVALNQRVYSGAFSECFRYYCVWTILAHGYKQLPFRTRGCSPQFFSPFVKS